MRRRGVRDAAAAVALALVARRAGLRRGQDEAARARLPGARARLVPAAPPAGLDPFYKKYLDGDGIPVLASAAVSDDARSGRVHDRRAHAEQARRRPPGDDRPADARRHHRRQRGDDRHPRVRATSTRCFPGRTGTGCAGSARRSMIPVSSVGEENLLCLPDDIFAGEQLLVQTFATAVLLGVEEADNTFESAAARCVRRRDQRRPVAEHLRRGQNDDRVLRGGRPELVRREPRRRAARRQHNDRSTRAPSCAAYDPALAALVARDDARRLLAPEVPVSVGRSATAAVRGSSGCTKRFSGRAVVRRRASAPPPRAGRRPGARCSRRSRAYPSCSSWSSSGILAPVLLEQPAHPGRVLHVHRAVERADQPVLARRCAGAGA